MTEIQSSPSQPREGSERFAERTSALAFLISAAAFLGLAVVYWRGGQPQGAGNPLGNGFAGPAHRAGAGGKQLLSRRPVGEGGDDLRHPTPGDPVGGEPRPRGG